MKDLGKLGQMVRACEGDAPRAARALATAAFHWDEFCSRASALDCALPGPGAPHVGFLLEHFEVAVGMAEEPALKPAKRAERDRVTPLVVELDEQAREDYLRFLEEN